MNPRAKAFLLLLILIPLGFGTKYYQGPGQELFNNSVAGTLYVVFWCVAVFWAFPRLPAMKNTVLVCSFTCILEVLQLWHPPFLDAIRNTFLGRAILGTTFAPMDFFFYVMGAVAACLLLKKLDSTQQAEASS